MDLSIRLASDEAYDFHSFLCEFQRSLGEMESPADLTALLSMEAEAPFESSDEVRLAVRDLLRIGGFKPTGRSKPASEYLIRAAGSGRLGSINLAVDACNAVSLHSGLPISVVDADLLGAGWQIQCADPGTKYIFNPSGQEMDIGGLLCFGDAEGPCANAVKDSQRTKTSEKTIRTLTIVWGAARMGIATDVSSWYQTLLEPYCLIRDVAFVTV